MMLSPGGLANLRLFKWDFSHSYAVVDKMPTDTARRTVQGL